VPAAYRDALEGYFVIETNEHYEEGEVIAGVHWRNGSIETTLDLFVVPSVGLSSVELELTFDASFINGVVSSPPPNLVLVPKARSSFAAWEGGSLDRNGQPVNPHSPTPEDLQALNSYPTNVFIFKADKLYHDLPLKLVFVGGNGYQLGHFTEADGSWIPHHLRVSVKYQIQYKGEPRTVSVDKDIQGVMM